MKTNDVDDVRDEANKLYKNFFEDSKIDNSKNYEPQELEKALKEAEKDSFVLVENRGGVALVLQQNSEPEDFEVFFTKDVKTPQIERTIEEISERVYEDNKKDSSNDFTVRVRKGEAEKLLQLDDNYYHVEIINDNFVEEGFSTGRVAFVIRKPIGLEFRCKTIEPESLKSLEKKLVNVINETVELTYVNSTNTLVCNIGFREESELSKFVSSIKKVGKEGFQQNQRDELIEDVKDLLNEELVVFGEFEYNDMFSGSLPFKTRETGEINRPWH